MSAYIPYIIAGSVGAAIALIELAARFAEDPKWLITNIASWFYLIINASVSMLVYAIFMSTNISIGGIPLSNNEYMAAGVIGLTAMGILRSSILNIKFGDNSTDIGLHKTIDILLNWIEKIYDRNKSKRLIKEVSPLVANIPYQWMHRAIVPTCMSALTRLSAADNSDITTDGEKLANEPNMPERAKTNQLAVRTVKITGIDLFRESVKVYEEEALGGAIPTPDNLRRIAEIQERLLSAGSSEEEQ